MLEFILSAILTVAVPASSDGSRPIKAPALVGKPTPSHRQNHSMMIGIPSIAVSDGGRLWACWYGSQTAHLKHGYGEDENNFVSVATSTDNGANWEIVFVVDPDYSGPRRAFDPEIWVDPDGHLRVTWTDRYCKERLDASEDQLWMIDIENADDVPDAIPAPVCIGEGIMMCKPTVLADGTWAFPVAKWGSEVSSTMLVTEDHGKTWNVRGGASMPAAMRLYDEHMFIQKTDGEIQCYARAKKAPDAIVMATSADCGRTWTTHAPVDGIKHTSSRFFIRKLASGNWLLVKNGPVTQDVGRRQMMAFISRDEGESWEGGLLLYEEDKVSYPDGQQTADGTIYLIYDHDRTGAKDIFVSCFTEEDVLAGRDVSGKVILNRKITINE